MPSLASTPLQFGGDVNSLLNIVWLLSFFVFIVYGQRIQIYIVANDISRALNRLKVMKDRTAMITKTMKAVAPMMIG